MIVEDYFVQAEELHDQAMNLSDEAYLAQARGDEAAALTLLYQAALSEKAAADLLPAEEEYEPSRGILYRSAATLAYNSENYKMADRLVANGLSGYPPPDIEKELKDLYDDINFMRHAEAEGIKIEQNGFVITVAGEATKHGGSAIDLVLNRLSQIQDEFYRTVERLLGLEYRTNKPVDKKIRNKFNLYLDSQFASSFGMHILVGAPEDQMHLFPELKIKEDVEGKEVVREVMECLRILEGANPQAINDRIQDEAYRDDFIGFAKQIAPDGEKIKTVAFRSSEDTKNGVLILRKTKTQLKNSKIVPQVNDGDEESTFELTGYLRRATSPKSGKYGNIGLDSPEQRKRVPIKVPIGYMKTTVQPFFEELVLASGYIQGGIYYLTDIETLDE